MIEMCISTCLSDDAINDYAQRRILQGHHGVRLYVLGELLLRCEPDTLSS
jgi:hypothetical protein